MSGLAETRPRPRGMSTACAQCGARASPTATSFCGWRWRARKTFSRACSFDYIAQLSFQHRTFELIYKNTPHEPPRRGRSSGAKRRALGMAGSGAPAKRTRSAMDCSDWQLQQKMPRAASGGARVEPRAIIPVALTARGSAAWDSAVHPTPFLSRRRGLLAGGSRSRPG